MNSSASVVLKPTVMKDKARRVEGHEIRELRNENEQLRKELDRKDSRNENQAKELQQLRQTVANLQRELKSVSGQFEKAQADRILFLNEQARLRDYVDRVEKQNFRLSDSHSLITTIDRHQEQIDQLQNKLNQAEGILASRDARIKALEREQEILQRSMESQIQYHDGLTSSSQGREMMRSLYYELGKRKTDLQNLAAALSSSSHEVENLQMQLRELSTHKNDLEDTVIDLRHHCDELIRCNQSDSQSIHALESEVADKEHIIASSHAKIEDLSAKLVTMTSAHDDLTVENHKQTSLLQVEIENYLREISTLKTHISGLQQQVSHTENIKELLERQRESEHKQISVERQQLNEKVSKCYELEIENEKIQNKLISIDNAREELAIKLFALHDQFEKEAGSWKQELHERNVKIRKLEETVIITESKLKHSEKERDDAIVALKQTMAATKDLNIKYKEEVASRLVLEQRLRNSEQIVKEVERNKIDMSTAIMDALSKERSRVVELESQLHRESELHRESQLHRRVPPQQVLVHNSHNSASGDQSLRSNIFDTSAWIDAGSIPDAHKDLVFQALQQHLPKHDENAIPSRTNTSRDRHDSHPKQVHSMSQSSNTSIASTTTAPHDPMSARHPVPPPPQPRSIDMSGGQSSIFAKSKHVSSFPQGSPDPDPSDRPPIPLHPTAYPSQRHAQHDGYRHSNGQVSSGRVGDQFSFDRVYPEVDSSFDSTADLTISTVSSKPVASQFAEDRVDPRSASRSSIPRATTGYHHSGIGNEHRRSQDSHASSGNHQRSHDSHHRVPDRQINVDRKLPEMEASKHYDIIPSANNSIVSETPSYVPRDEKQMLQSEVEVVTDRNTAIRGGVTVLNSSTSTIGDTSLMRRDDGREGQETVNKKPLTMVAELKRLRDELRRMENQVPLSPGNLWEHKSSSPRKSYVLHPDSILQDTGKDIAGEHGGFLSSSSSSSTSSSSNTRRSGSQSGSGAGSVHNSLGQHRYQPDTATSNSSTNDGAVLLSSRSSSDHNSPNSSNDGDDNGDTHGSSAHATKRNGLAFPHMIVN